MASYDVPHDIVENILSRLPVKSLIRFKCVCKQWSAIISHPKFAEIHHHLQKSNFSSCSYLKSRCGVFSFTRIQLENNEFRELSVPVRGYPNLLAHCDGLFLFSPEGSKVNYLVLNQSSRTYKEARCPYPIYANRVMKSGICYDPLMKDYKAVIGDEEHYAVYYCKRNSWSELKEMNINVQSDMYHYGGVHFDGSIYWIARSSFEEEEEEEDDDEPRPPNNLYRFEIVCFDGRDEKMKNFPSPDCIAEHACLISSRDCLYFMPTNDPRYNRPSKEMVVMKKVAGDHDHPWMEFNLELPFPCKVVRPLCCVTRENQIMLWAMIIREKLNISFTAILRDLPH